MNGNIDLKVFYTLRTQTSVFNVNILLCINA